MYGHHVALYRFLMSDYFLSRMWLLYASVCKHSEHSHLKYGNPKRDSTTWIRQWKCNSLMCFARHRTGRYKYLNTLNIQRSQLLWNVGHKRRSGAQQFGKMLFSSKMKFNLTLHALLVLFCFRCLQTQEFENVVQQVRLKDLPTSFYRKLSAVE